VSFRTLDAFTIRDNWPTAWGASGKLVVGLDKDVVGTDGVQYPAMAKAGSAYKSLGFHFESAITVADGVAICASITDLPTTDTATPVNTARYHIYIYDAKGAMRQKLSRSPFHLHESVNGDFGSFSWQQWVNAQQFKQGSSQLPMIGDRATLQGMVDAAFLQYTSHLVGINAANYSSLSSALSAASSVPLIVSTLQAVTADLTASIKQMTVPYGGGFNVSSGKVLTLDVDSFEAGDYQIFFGDGTVEFTKYPRNFNPHWFGAADYPADSRSAFQKLLASMAKTDAGLPLGGRIELTKFFYLSDSLEVDRTIHLLNMGGRDSAGLIFPENKRGLILHSISSKTGVYDVANGRAENCVIENTSIVAQAGDTMLTTVTVNGLTVTRTAGELFDVSATVQDGNTITIKDGSGNPHEYEIGSVGASSITLQDNWPLLVNAPGGAAYVTNIGFQKVTLDWIGATIRINGVNYTITNVVPNGTDYGYGAALGLSGNPPAGNYNAKIVGGFSSSKTGRAARHNYFHGIDLRTTATLRNLRVVSWHGNGVNANSTQTPSYNLSVEPNANNARIDRVWSDFNLGCGIYLKGVNSNNCLVENCSGQNNHARFINDNSFLGNNQLSNHALSNYLGAYSTAQGGNNVSNLFGLYSEGDAPANVLGSKTFAVGGNYANDIDRAVESPVDIGRDGELDRSYVTQGSNLKLPPKVLTVADTTGTIDTDHTVYLADTSGGAINYNLLSPQPEHIGRVFVFRKLTGASAFMMFAIGGADIVDETGASVGSVDIPLTGKRLQYYATGKWAVLP
jgi:hypothetical protein